MNHWIADRSIGRLIDQRVRLGGKQASPLRMNRIELTDQPISSLSLLLLQRPCLRLDQSRDLRAVPELHREEIQQLERLLLLFQAAGVAPMRRR